MNEPKKCGCGKTKNAEGFCDGSHNALKAKEVPFNQITIRVLGTENQKVKHVYPSIANNKQLMRNMRFAISDPNYEAKMEAFKNKKSYSENGISKEPIKEAFANPVLPTKEEAKIEQPKNEIIAPAIIDEPRVKRTRRTKEQMLADKQTKKQTA